ncbi:MAG: DUF3429 domain-containing protein [Porticoccus sp.]|uniref:DUF3429 domain-containing protein n=1 Tax=Porticoccus sp. TaxID=2024853 RepID=UPI0032996CD3
MSSSATSKRIPARLFTYSGILPFLFFPCYRLLTGSNTFFAFDVQTLLMGYGAVIVAFVAGIHWGVFLFRQCSLNLLLHSNIIALLSWVSLLSTLLWSVVILLFCFVYLLWIDTVLVRQQLLEPWFYRLRVHASALALLSLVSYAVIAL